MTNCLPYIDLDCVIGKKIIYDLIYFYSSSWISTATTFKSAPLNVIQLDWKALCRSKGQDNKGRRCFYFEVSYDSLMMYASPQYIGESFSTACFDKSFQILGRILHKPY